MLASTCRRGGSAGCWIARGLALAALALGGCRNDEAADPPELCVLVRGAHGAPGTASVKAKVVASGLEVPWAIGFLPGGGMLVTERPGRIRLVRDGAIAATVATLRVAGGEGGLLGLAVHPRFEENRLFYIYLTVGERGRIENRVERWALAPDSRSAELDRVILRGIPAARFHDGGRMRFGPDGMLYIGTGDARAPERSQDRSSLAGKILRVSPDGEAPGDNPFPGSPVFLLGLRNPEGFDWRDPRTLLVADHGPSGEMGMRGHDEISVAKAGENLGWPAIHGCEARAGMVTPQIAWQEAVPPGGAAFYTGRAIPEWRGSLIVATLGAKHLHRVALSAADPRQVERHEAYFRGDSPTGFGRLREVIMGLDGELYVTTSNCDGRGICPAEGDRILRITR